MELLPAPCFEPECTKKQYIKKMGLNFDEKL